MAFHDAHLKSSIFIGERRRAIEYSRAVQTCFSHSASGSWQHRRLNLYSIHDFGLISIVVYFEIKVYNMVKNSQATGSERAVVENTRANQRALTAARDPVLWLPPLCWRKLRSVCYVTWLPRHNEERFHYPSAEGISNQSVLWNDRIIVGTPEIRRLPRHHDERL